MAAPFELIHSDSTLVVARSDDLLMAVWWDAPTVAQMDVIGNALALLARRGRGPTAFVQYVIAGTPRFSSDVRQKAQDLTRAGNAKATAHVIEIQGMAGSAARAFLSALMLVTQRDKRVRVFSTPQEAAVWLTDELGGSDEGWNRARILETRQRAMDSRA